MAKYSRKIVAFVDILGFSVLLNKFEKEALNNDKNGMLFHQSESLNRLIAIIEENINLIRENNYNYYVFSDNICITADYVVGESEKPDTFIEILLLLSRIYYEFIKEGYFLRGGVDVGWFADDIKFAIGKPLANAYLLEHKKAVYPRILLSDNFYTFFNKYRILDSYSDRLSNYVDIVIAKRYKYFHVNYFNMIFRMSDNISRIKFLSDYRDKISSNLILYQSNLKLFRKYNWMKLIFNNFIDSLIINTSTYSHSIRLSKIDINKIKNLKL